MVTNKGGLTLIDNLVEDMQQEQTLFERKANTVSAALGSIATTVLAMGAYWLESGTAIPSWFPMMIFIAGMVATVFKVSKTPNGITSSVATKLQDGLAAKIDLEHNHELETEVIPDSPVVQQFAVDKALELRSEADSLLSYRAENE